MPVHRSWPSRRTSLQLSQLLTSSFAYWLVDPSIDANARMGRGVAAQAADYEEQRKFEEASGRTVADPPGKLAVDRLSDLMAAARGLNLVRQNRNGVDILTVGVPPTVGLFDRYEPVSARARQGTVPLSAVLRVCPRQAVGRDARRC